MWAVGLDYIICRGAKKENETYQSAAAEEIPTVIERFPAIYCNDLERMDTLAFFLGIFQACETGAERNEQVVQSPYGGLMKYLPTMESEIFTR
ncbi:putative endonuclease [Anopheles sinensis]|uniref:Putative endonuclease n=1 Tax=Anopheles sinensis TaxID=74873 RepID=A0A084VKB8_ANOSI|nr:putative endonuclease [Anopheles sinensis]